MTCERIDEKLLLLTAAGGMPEFTPEERGHLRTCTRCAGLTAGIEEAAGRIAAASARHRPGPEYWGSILPRVRGRVERRRSPSAVPVIPAFVRALMPVAAAVVAAILISVTALEPPAPPAGGEIIAALSAEELYDLRQSGRYTGLLEPAEANGAAESGVAELLAELLSEKGDEALYAIAEPEELLHDVDEQQFTEIVSMLEHR